MNLHRKLVCVLLAFVICAGFAHAQDAVGPGSVEYRVLATKKTSTTQKEMNEAAEAGFRRATVGM